MPEQFQKKYKFFYHVLRGAFSRRFLGHSVKERSEAMVKEEYEKNYELESNFDFIFKPQKTLLFGWPALMPVAGYKKLLLKRFADIFSFFGVGSVLELGSGRGLNLLALAVLCPDLKKLRGVELTERGVTVAKANLKNPPLEILRHLTGLPESQIKESLRDRDIDFVCGSIRKIPFGDNEFDAVFSNSVIEQIPRAYGEVFAESARVAKRLGVWSEPFREAERNFFKRIYLKNINYFCQPISVVSNYGWRIVEFVIPPEQKFLFSTGFLTCVKKSNGQ